MAKSQRVSRLLELTCLLQRSRGWTAARLAERFGVSRTRMFDDLRALREAGVPVRSGKGGYHIDQSFFLPSLKLTRDEVLSLLPLGHGLVGSAPDGQRRRDAWAKLLSCLPTDLQRDARMLAARVDAEIPPPARGNGVCAALVRAIVRCEHVCIEREPWGEGKRESLAIEPLGLCYDGGGWFLIASMPGRDSIHRIRVAEIRRVEPTGLLFHDRGCGASMVTEIAPPSLDGAGAEAVVRFRARAARAVRHRDRADGASLQPLGGGAVLYRAEVDDLDAFARWLVGFGGEATVLRPTQLADRVVALAESAITSNRRPHTTQAQTRPLRSVGVS